MGIAIVLVLLVAGSVLFHFVSPWYFTPIASNWSAIDDTIAITFWVTGIVFVAVNLFLAWSVYRYRNRAGARARYEPWSSSWPSSSTELHTSARSRFSPKNWWNIWPTGLFRNATPPEWPGQCHEYEPSLA